MDLYEQNMCLDALDRAADDLQRMNSAIKRVIEEVAAVRNRIYDLPDPKDSK